MTGTRAKPGRIRIAAAMLVHAYTASGAILAFFGTRAALAQDARTAFLMMFIATIVDATDGALARLARVKEALPGVDGAKIDDIVDYITFVFLPLLLIDQVGGLPPATTWVVIAAVLLSSAYGFAAADAKTSDHFFTGFPSYWNIVVFYLFVFHVPPAWNAAILLALSAMVFVRIGYVYPSKMPTLRGLTIMFGCLWGVSLAVLIWTLPAPPRDLAIASLAFPVYYIVLSFVLHARRRQLAAAA